MEVDAANPQAGAAAEADTALKGQVEAEADETQEIEAGIDPDNTGEPEDDSEEVEYEGERYSLPKKLKEAIMRHSDYTQKTMKLADEAKAYETKNREFQDFQNAWRESAKDYATIQTIDARLEQFHKLTPADWNKMMDDDLVQTNKLQLEFNQLRYERDQLAQSLSNKENERRIRAQQETAKREEEGRSVLTREIKGYGPELERNLRDYAVAQGVPGSKELKFTQFPHETKILHKAFLYDQLKKQAQKPKEAEAEVKPVVPVKGGKSSSAPSEYRIGLQGAEYDRWRERQKPKKRH